MKLATYEHRKTVRIGALLRDGRMLDLAMAADLAGLPAAPFADRIAFIEAGEPVWQNVRRWIEMPPAGAILAATDLRLLSPLPRPTQIRDLANYEKHVRQAIASAMQLRAQATPNPAATLDKFRRDGLFDIPPIWYQQPLYYKGNRMTVVGPDAEIEWPAFAEKMDYELELAVVTAGPIRDLTPKNAMEAVFGYTIYNDFSARDAQARETQFRLGPAKGKDFDTGNSIGPFIVTRDEIPDPTVLAMSARVNGETKVKTTSGNMQHTLETILIHISKSETLYPGEIIGIGTVGDGCGYESLTWLKDGDIVELEVEGIGILRNRLVRRH